MEAFQNDDQAIEVPSIWHFISPDREWNLILRTAITKQHGMIGIETLNVNGMLTNHMITDSCFL